MDYKAILSYALIGVMFLLFFRRMLSGGGCCGGHGHRRHPDGQH